MREKEYAPHYGDLGVQWYPDSNSLEPNEVVGMAVTRDGRGYATRCFQSDGKIYEFPRDLEEFFTAKDDRIFFVDGVSRELEPILKHLGEKYCTELLDGYGVSSSGVTMHYHGSLSTRVSGGKSLRRIWSIKPFYPAHMLPDEDDCYGVQARGERLVKTMIKGKLPLKLSSCGAILNGLTRLPFHSCPTEVAEMAYNCYHGGWIEAMKLGHYDDAYDYDLSSAYPTEASKLLSCSGKCGAWYHTSEFIQGAAYGFCYCTVRMDINLPLTPVMFRLRSVMTESGRYPVRVVRNPIGAWRGWMTKDEIEFVVRNWLGSVEIEDGWWFVPSRYFRPFEELVKKLSVLRNVSEQEGDWLGRNLGKIIAASIQGKFMQSFLRRGERVVGNAFNPVYAAAITSRVRLKVAEVALENCDDILMVMIDGILASKPLATPGQWKLAHRGDCVVANHGDYDIEGRVVVGNLKKALIENEDDTSYPLVGPRYVSITEAIEGGTFEYAGRRRPETRARVSKVGKRCWDELPKICDDLLTKQYESTPLFVSERVK